MMHRPLIICLVLLSLSFSSVAVVEQQVFANEQLEQRYKALINEFRCLVCQNQNLADSNAELAKDLRRKTAEMLNAGTSDSDIRKYMRDRYGDFVSYRPALNAGTSVLWFGPFIVLLCVLIVLVMTIRRRQSDEQSNRSQTDDEAQRAKVRNLLRDAPSLDPLSLHEPNKDD